MYYVYWKQDGDKLQRSKYKFSSLEEAQAYAAHFYLRKSGDPEDIFIRTFVIYRG